MIAQHLNNLFASIVGVSLLISLLAWQRKASWDLVVKQSFVDGKDYLVRKMPDAQKAADQLATIKNNILRLIRHLKQKFPKNEGATLLSQNFDPQNLSEASKWTRGTSYSLNKGQQVVMCLRHKSDDSFVDMNTLMFVTLHEMAHLATKSIGHTPEFWANFKFLLKEAISLGIYDYHAYHKTPMKYCGMHIADTPLKK